VPSSTTEIVEPSITASISEVPPLPTPSASITEVESSKVGPVQSSLVERSVSSVITTKESTTLTTQTSGPVITSPPYDPGTTTAPITSSYSISTIYTTSIYTITYCHPTVTNCPYGHVTTATVSLYTTICPVTQNPPPLTTPAEVWTTSTIYTTITYTITACAPTIQNCPYGDKTTETIPVYTTVCPENPGQNQPPAVVIGVLITIIIDITIEININNGVTRKYSRSADENGKLKTNQIQKRLT
jgi:chitinase